MIKKNLLFITYYNKTIQNIISSSFVADDINKFFQLNDFEWLLNHEKAKNFFIFFYIY